MLLLALIACGAPADVPPPPSWSGTWSGTAPDGRVLTLQVAEGGGAIGWDAAPPVKAELRMADGALQVSPAEGPPLCLRGEITGSWFTGELGTPREGACDGASLVLLRTRDASGAPTTDRPVERHTLAFREGLATPVADADPELERLVLTLAAERGRRVRVTGQAAAGEDPALAQQRAAFVVSVLLSRGLAPDQLQLGAPVTDAPAPGVALEPAEGEGAGEIRIVP